MLTIKAVEWRKRPTFSSAIRSGTIHYAAITGTHSSKQKRRETFPYNYRCPIKSHIYRLVVPWLAFQTQQKHKRNK